MLPILPHQTHWFSDCENLCSLHGSPDDVVKMTVALLSRCTSPAGQAMQAPCINCFAAYTCMGLARSASNYILLFYLFFYFFMYCCVLCAYCAFYYANEQTFYDLSHLTILRITAVNITHNTLQCIIIIIIIIKTICNAHKVNG